MAVNKKTTQSAKKGKLARFFGNPRNVIIAVFVLGFAVVGGYKVYQSSALSTEGSGKNTTNVTDCYVLTVQGGSKTYIREGSRYGCVRTYEKALSAINKYNGHKIRDYELSVDDYFSSVNKYQTITYQQLKAIEASGTVGPKTWGALYSDCTTLGYYYPAVKSECGL